MSFFIHFRHPFEAMVGPFIADATAQQYLAEDITDDHTRITARIINVQQQMKPEEFAEECGHGRHHWSPDDDPIERFRRSKRHHQC